MSLSPARRGTGLIAHYQHFKQLVDSQRTH
jgi:hypothetical protein